MPPFSTRAATSSSSSCVRGCSSPVLLVHEQRDRHAPGALARDAPVRPVLDHAGDALLAPGRRPLHFLDVAQRVRAQALLVHADEPLRRGAEDHRRLVAPAMRIAVLDTARDAQPAARLQLLDDGSARLRPASCRRRAACPAGSGRRCRPGCRPAGCSACRPRSLPGRAPGAVCTAPVPASSVTCSPRITGTCRSWNGCCSFSPSSAAPVELARARGRCRHAVALRGMRPARSAASTSMTHACADRHPRARLSRARSGTHRAAPPPGWRAASRASSSR